jgi:hypothetical protein
MSSSDGVSFQIVDNNIAPTTSVPPRPTSPSTANVMTHLGPVWQGSGSSKNGFGSGSSGGVPSLVELESF